MATVYAVASAKGGVGKTTTTAAIATILADSGADVVAIDADIGMANLAGAVGVTPGETTLHDVLAGEADPDDAVHEGPAGLRVVPGSPGLDAYAAADPSELKAVIDAFDDADYVFVDAGAGLSHDSTLPLGLADETLLVSTAERSALGDTEKTRQLTERIGGTVAGAAITRIAADDDADDVAETLDAAVLGRIPEDEAVLRAVDASESLPTFAPEAPSTRAYRDLTRALTGADVEGEGLDEGVAAGIDESDESDESDDADEEGSEDDEADEDDDIPEQPGPIGEAEAVEEPDADEEREADESEEAGAESEAPENGIADETETVGEKHVGAEDLEAMVEKDIGEAERFDAETDRSAGDEASTTGDEASTADDETTAEGDVDADATDDEEATDAEAASPDSESDIDDELEGSVPFRDDDTDRVGTVGSDEDTEDDGAEDESGKEDESGAEDETGAEDGDEPATEDEPKDGDETEEETDDDSRGFFSRLLGR